MSEIKVIVRALDNDTHYPVWVTTIFQDNNLLSQSKSQSRAQHFFHAIMGLWTIYTVQGHKLVIEIISPFNATMEYTRKMFEGEYATYFRMEVDEQEHSLMNTTYRLTARLQSYPIPTKTAS